jgi:hypothetical protein
MRSIASVQKPLNNLNRCTCSFSCFFPWLFVSHSSLDNNLTLGYHSNMTKASKAATELARLSVAARRRKWGKAFNEKMREFGRLGGRPRKDKGNGN